MKIVKRFAVDIKGLKNFTANQTKETFIEVVNKFNLYKFYKNFTNYGKETNKVILFSCRHLSNILKYKDYR